MADFEPGEDRLAIESERSVVSWVLLGLFVVLAAAGGWVYQFRPKWVTGDPPRVSLPITPAPDDQPQINFGALYQRYGMTALAATTAGDRKVRPLLTVLQKEPCEAQTVFQTSVALESLHEIRGAAELLKGFADTCPESSGERYRASELFYLIGDYDTAARLSSDLINHQPDAQLPYFIRGKSEQALKQYAAAVEDYSTLIRLLPDTKSIVSEVFTRMSDSYEQLDRPCEAIGPIQTYIALDSEKRATPALLRRITALAAKGSCAQAYAKGTARIPRRSHGVSTARVEINGIEGTFVVDTGASFVTLTPAFAGKAKPRMLQTDSIEMQTANGKTSATLATVDSVRLAGLSASAVPAIVAGKSLGDGVDGLLGMSFLSRFTVVMLDREIQLKAKTLGE